MKLSVTKTMGVWVIAVMLLGAIAIADLVNFSPAVRDETMQPPQEQPAMAAGDRADYEGRIRIYMVEPVSTLWNMNDGTKYHQIFLDYAYDTVIAMDYMDTLQRTIVWNAVAAGHSYVTQGNIMAVAAVTNAVRVPGYSDPPDGNYFDAYYVDACAAADPANSWPNQVTDDFTHTVFVEKGTARW